MKPGNTVSARCRPDVPMSRGEPEPQYGDDGNRRKHCQSHRDDDEGPAVMHRRAARYETAHHPPFAWQIPSGVPPGDYSRGRDVIIDAFRCVSCSPMMTATSLPASSALPQHSLRVRRSPSLHRKRDRSGASNSLTLDRPLTVRRAPNGFLFVNGTPTDCVHLAVTGLLDHLPDLVISGINLGANMGDDTIYSGTVAAATEGFLLGIPSIAISLASKAAMHFETAAAVALRTPRSARAASAGGASAQRQCSRPASRHAARVIASRASGAATRRRMSCGRRIRAARPSTGSAPRALRRTPGMVRTFMRSKRVSHR